MHKNLLITGATGFIGGFLVQEALKQGYIVFAATRATSNTDLLKSLGNVTIIVVDFSNPNEISQLIDKHKINYIINNAGLTKSKSEEKMNEVNANNLAHLINATKIANQKIKRLVQISSLAAFGPADFTKEGVISNESTPHPVTMYGRSKLRGETILTSQSHLPYAIIRPTAVFGPNEKDLFTVFKMINTGLQSKVGLKDQKLTFIYVKDLVVYMVNALSKGSDNQAYFISDGSYYSNHQFNEVVRKVLRKKTIKISLPLWFIKVLAYLSEWAGNITGSLPPLNIDKFQELKAQSWVCDTTPNINLEYSPQYDLEEAIQETADWYKSNHWL